MFVPQKERTKKEVEICLIQLIYFDFIEGIKIKLVQWNEKRENSENEIWIRDEKYEIFDQLYFPLSYYISFHIFSIQLSPINSRFKFCFGFYTKLDIFKSADIAIKKSI